MKQYFLRMAGLAAMVLLFQPFSFAQQEKGKTEDKKEIMDGQDELIISRKNDKDSKVTVEIKNGQVFVNGKQVDDFEDENISIRKRGRRSFNDEPVIAVGPGSPFRVENWGFNGNDMMEMNDSKRPLLGVSSDKADGGGALVNEVTKGSAAEKIGLKKGDIITKIDESAIGDPEDLIKVIRKYKPEDKVVVTYKRAGKEEKATAVLGKYKMDFDSVYGLVTPKEFHYDMDMTVPPMNTYRNYAPRAYVFNIKGPKIGIKAQDTEDAKGAKVMDVDDDSPAAKAGIKEADVITQMDGKNVTSANELAEAARGARNKSTFKVKLTRAGKPMELDVKIPKKLNTADL
jgi:serine protease Do